MLCQNDLGRKDNFRQTNGGGLYIGGTAGDYIKLPAIKDYRLQNIAVSLNKTSDFHIIPSNSIGSEPEDIVSVGACTSTQSGDYFMLYLSETLEGVSYAMMLDNIGCFRSITLYYRK